MSNQTSKPPRWEWVPVNVSVPLGRDDTAHPSNTSRTFDLTDDAGAQIAQAIAQVDTRRQLVTIRELRYDASRATVADARAALERFLHPPVPATEADEAAEEPATEPTETPPA